jgi:hypothetical protein
MGQYLILLLLTHETSHYIMSQVFGKCNNLIFAEG